MLRAARYARRPHPSAFRADPESDVKDEAQAIRAAGGGAEAFFEGIGAPIGFDATRAVASSGRIIQGGIAGHFGKTNAHADFWRSGPRRAVEEKADAVRCRVSTAVSPEYPKGDRPTWRHL